jgi:hypothetical protein
MTENEAMALVKELNLRPHPEGGFFTETFRSAIAIEAPLAPRIAMTAIHYLLSAEHFSAFHRLTSDEIWHYYRGSHVAIEIINAGGEHRRITIGDGRRWQCALPAGTWFAAYVCHPHDFALIGCDVAPGFEFEDFELAEREALVTRFPQHRELIERYTRA